MITYLKKNYQMHIVVHHADGDCYVREYYIESAGNGKIVFLDKKTGKVINDSDTYCVGVAFFEAYWEIYKYPEDLK